MMCCNHNLFKIGGLEGCNLQNGRSPSIHCIPNPSGGTVEQTKALGSNSFGGGGAEMTQIRIMDIRICSNWELQKVETLKPMDTQQLAAVITPQDAPWTDRNYLEAIELVQEEEK